MEESPSPNVCKFILIIKTDIWKEKQIYLEKPLKLSTFSASSWMKRFNITNFLHFVLKINIRVQEIQETIIVCILIDFENCFFFTFFFNLVLILLWKWRKFVTFKHFIVHLFCFLCFFKTLRLFFDFTICRKSSLPQQFWAKHFFWISLFSARKYLFGR